MTMAPEAICKALENITKHKASLRGAQLIGVHLEGPFLNPAKKGAQDARYIQAPSLALIEPYIESIKMITLAPEMEGANAFIERLQRDYPHIILSIGHTEATYEESKESFDWGISHATHLFNAMPPLHHRHPGVVGAVLSETRITCDVIADLIHLHPAILEMVWQAKREQLILITDAMRAGCIHEGTYTLGGQCVTVKGGKALLDDGTLAGSVLRLNDAIRHMVTYTSMTLPQAIFAVTQRPAHMLQLKKGALKRGYDADIVIFDRDYSMITTMIAGKVVYQRR